MPAKRDSESHTRGISRGAQDGACDLDETKRRAHVDALIAEGRELRHIDLDRMSHLAGGAIDLAREPGPGGTPYVFGTAAALSLMAFRDATEGDSRQALTNAQRALAMLDHSTPSQLVGDLYDTMAWAHFSMGSFVDALTELMKTIEIAEAIGDTTLKANALDTMGNVHTVSGHPEEGLELHMRALDLHRGMGDRFNETLSLNNAVYTFLDLGRDEEALEYAMLALERIDESGPQQAVTAVLDTVADVCLRLGRLDEAEKYAHHAHEIALERDNPRDEADSLLTLGNLASLRGRFDEAEQMTARALQLAEEQQRWVEVATAHHRLSEIQQERGDLIGALAHFRSYHDLESKRVSAETQAQLASLRVEHQVETAKKDAEIHRLRNLALEREVEERRIAQTRLEAQASLDPLTGLFNRRHLSVLADELERAMTTGTPVAVMLCDIDRFKTVNDEHGHLVGDSVLSMFARLLRDHGHVGDTSVRYGGDEFLVVLIGADGAIARSSAERLRKKLAHEQVESGDGRFTVTASFGVVAAPRDGSVTLVDLIGDADRALYAAKNSGRDCVVGCEP